MPLYAFQVKGSDEVVEEALSISEAPKVGETFILSDGRKAVRIWSLSEDIVRRNNPWPKHQCASFACGKHELQKHMEFARKKGVPTEYKYNPKTRDYSPVFTCHAHKEKFVRAKGYLLD